MNALKGNRPKHIRLPFPTQREGQLPSKLFLIAYCIWLPLMILNTSAYAKYLGGGIYSVGRMACISLLILSILLDFKTTMRSIAGFAVAILLGISALRSADTVLIDGILLILCGRKEDFRSVAKLSLAITSGLLFFIILSSLVGIIPNYSGWSGGRQRYYIGFRYALYPSNYMFMISCVTTCLLNTRLRIKHVLGLFVANYVIFYYTTSRLSFYLSCIVILSSYILALVENRFFKKGIPRNPIVGILLASSYSIMLIISFAAAFNYSPSNQIFQYLDGVNVFGGRIGISSNAVQTYGFNLFGREMHFYGAALSPNGAPVVHNAASYNYIDNLFIKTTINYGVVFMALFLLIFTAITWRAYWEDHSFIVLALVMIALHCCVDNAMLHLYYNTFLLLAGKLMLKPDYSSSPFLKRLTSGFYSLFFLMITILMLIVFVDR